MLGVPHNECHNALNVHLQTPPPDPGRIPDDDLLGATVVMITCSYKSQEFIRVGYWINNTYGETLPEGERTGTCATPHSDYILCGECYVVAA